MTKSADTLIGHIVDVQGGSFSVFLHDNDQSEPLSITIGDEDVIVGQVGSYVSIHQANANILALVTRMTEQEKVSPLGPGDRGGDAVLTPYAQRIIALAPIGSINESGEFERGVSSYPTTGAEVHAVGSAELKILFARFQDKGYDVGYLSANPSLQVCFDPTPLFGRHFAILGQTGAGKSWTVANLIQRAVAVMPKAHIILLDMHGEYHWIDDDKKARSAFSEETMRYVDARDLEIPYWLMTYAELCDLLIEYTEREAANQTTFFRDTLLELRTKEKEPLKLDRITVDTPVFFSLDEMLEKIRAKNSEKDYSSSKTGRQGPMYGDFDRFLMRLESRLNDVRYDFLLKPKFRTASNTLSGLLRDFVGLGVPKRPITVIDLSSVPSDVRPTVAAQIGRLAFEFNYWNPEYREFPILLICEEAHAYIPRENLSQFAGSRKSMERIAKEGRKYGVGLGVVSQRPHEVSETVLSHCVTFICLRITNPDDQSYLRSLVPEAERDLVSILAGLGRGEALALGEAVPLPTRLQFHTPNPQPNSDDVDFFAKWKDGPDDLDVDEIVDRWRRQEREPRGE